MPLAVDYSLRETGMKGMFGLLTAYPHSGVWEVSLLYAGVELASANGYARAEITVGILTSCTWTRSGTTITVTTPNPHGFVSGEVAVIQSSSDNSAAPAGNATVTVTDDTHFTYTGLNAGATSGTLSLFPHAFWLLEGDSVTWTATQDLGITFPSASGGAWKFDELRFHDALVVGGKLLAFKFAAEVTIQDGDTLIIPKGTLKVVDYSPQIVS